MLAVNWEMSMGRQICAVQQDGLSHLASGNSTFISDEFGFSQRWKKCGRKSKTKEIKKCT